MRSDMRFSLTTRIGAMNCGALFFALWIVAVGASAQDQAILKLTRSEVTFTSEAPLETIRATNARSVGALDIRSRTFAVQVPIASFEGFNSPLQREHFNENYLLSGTYPKCVFQGRIIETLDLLVPGGYAVRAKGLFTLKDRSVERIIPCQVIVSEKGVRVTALFDVSLDEHGIRVPRIVQQKIAATVQVKVDMLFTSPGGP